MTANTAQVISSVPPTAQVIQFPKTKLPTPQDADDALEVVASVLDMKVAAAEEALSFIIGIMFRDIENAGFKFADERKVLLLIAQTRAMMYEHLGLDHPLNAFIDAHGEQIDTILANQLDLLDFDEFED